MFYDIFTTGSPTQKVQGHALNVPYHRRGGKQFNLGTDPLFRYNLFDFTMLRDGSPRNYASHLPFPFWPYYPEATDFLPPQRSQRLPSFELSVNKKFIDRL